MGDFMGKAKPASRLWATFMTANSRVQVPNAIKTSPACICNDPTHGWNRPMVGGQRVSPSQVYIVCVMVSVVSLVGRPIQLNRPVLLRSCHRLVKVCDRYLVCVCVFYSEVFFFRKSRSILYDCAVLCFHWKRLHYWAGIIWSVWWFTCIAYC